MNKVTKLKDEHTPSNSLDELINEWESIMHALDEMKVNRRRQKAVAKIAVEDINEYAKVVEVPDWIMPTKLTSRHFKKSEWKARDKAGIREVS
jgi:hypothetical protein